MAEKDESLFGGLFDTPEEPIRPETVGALDYITDIPIGALKGVSQAVQGLLQLGALPIDYLADTNLITAIDNIFDKITPETDTVVGDVTAVLGQFALPAGVAMKLASGITKLSKASQITKLNSFRKADGAYDFAAAGGELAKRAGYYGSIGGITDFAVSTPGDLKTLSETFGYGEAYKGNELEGSAKASEFFKEKIKFGAEGLLIGGGVTAALPVAGTLGFKYGLVPAAKAGAFVGKNLVIRPIDYAVFRPIGYLGKTEIAGRGARNTMEFLGNQTTNLRKKLGIPDPKDWKFYSVSPTAPLKERIFKRIDNIINAFKSDGPLSGSQAQELRNYENAVQADEKSLVKLMNRIDSDFKEVAKGADLMELPKYLRTPKLKYPKPITAIDDQMYLRLNDLLYDYISTPLKQKDDIARLLGKIEDSITNPKLKPNIIKNVKDIKLRINDLGLRYGKLLQMSPDDAIADFGKTIVENGGAYLKQVFSIMKNKAYDLNLAGDNVEAAKNFFVKNTVPKLLKEQPDLLNNLIKSGEAKTVKEAGEVLATKTMADLKKSLIESNRNPDSLFRLISRSFRLTGKEGQLLDTTKKIIQEGKEVSVLTSEGKLLQAGGNVQDVMRAALKDEASFEPVTKAFLEPLKDYRAAVTDTFLQTSKNIHKKEFFDKFADNALANKYAFRSLEEARLANIPTQNLRQINSEFNKDLAQLDSKLLDSKLFNGGAGQKGLFMTPEIANAVKGTEEYLTRMYDIPLYSALMSVKAAGQIGKTVFSPMTQIRNVSTASFFALASGLIGGRVSLTDAFKLMADDIFPGKFVSVSDVAKKMEDRIARGIVDQNIEVNEIKAILDKAKKGKFTLSALMENPTVKKAFDLYQGGDNVWKVYADNFYQDALGTAFQFSSKGLKGDAAIRDNIIDWYRTVGKQDDVVADLVKANDEIAKIDRSLRTANAANKKSLLSQKENLVQNFKDIKDISAYLVTNTIPTYSKVPQIIKNIRNLPLGNFIAFPAEILRTSAHLIEIGARELTSNNPFIRQMGARRLVGAASVFGGTGTIIASAAEKITGVSDEKMEAFKRSVAPDYQKNSTLIPLTVSDDKGNFKYFNFSYTNPYDSMVRPVNAVLNAYGNGTLTNQSASSIVYNALIYDQLTDTPGAFTEFLTPFISESIGAGAVADLTIRDGRTKDGRTIFFPNDTAMEKIDAAFGHLIGQLEPGASRSARRVWKGVTQDFTDYGTTYDSTTELMALMSGLRVEDAKPMDSLPFIVTSYTKDLENIQRKFSSNVYRPNITIDGRIGYMVEYLTDNYDTQSRMYQVIKDMEAMGADEGDIEEKMNARLKNKKRLKAIMNGEYVAPNISEARIEGLFERLYDENATEAARIEDEFDTALDIFEDLRSDLKSIELGEGVESFREFIEFTLNPPKASESLSVSLDDLGIGSIKPVELPADPNLAIQPSGNVIAQTKKPLTFTEQVLKSGTLGERFLT